jgi:hypothetical protein
MREQLESLWARLAVCLVVSPLAFLAGGAAVLGAIHEAYGDDESCRLAGATCHDPRAWVAIALGAGGFALFALGVAAWLRAVQLYSRSKAATAAS